MTQCIDTELTRKEKCQGSGNLSQFNVNPINQALNYPFWHPISQSSLYIMSSRQTE